MTRGIKVERSSGNVFADLGLRDAEVAMARAEIAARVCDVIDSRGLTQAQAAALLQVDQPTVCHLMRGRLKRFSTDRLFRFLRTLDQDIEIVIHPKPARRRNARIRVIKRKATPSPNRKA